MGVFLKILKIVAMPLAYLFAKLFAPAPRGGKKDSKPEKLKAVDKNAGKLPPVSTKERKKPVWEE